MTDLLDFINDSGSSNESMSDLIAKLIKFLTRMTKKDSDTIESILKWDDDKKTAFFLARRIFDGEEEEE